MDYIRSKVALSVVASCYGLTLVAAAGPFAGLSEQNYNAPIIAIVHKEDLQNSLVPFQTLSENDRERNLVSLFNMFGTEEQIIKADARRKWNVDYRDYIDYRDNDDMQVRLIRLASALQLQSVAELRKQLFYIPDKRNAAESMFYRLIEDSNSSKEEICAWLPAEDAEQNKAYMVDFLNYLHRQKDDREELRADQNQKLFEVCEYVGIDWDAILCLPRMLVSGTINPAEEGVLKQFFSRYGIDFHEHKDSTIEEHRRGAFERFICPMGVPNEERFGEVMQVLGAYPFVCSVYRLLYDLDARYIEREVCFRPDVKSFCAYVLSLPICSPPTGDSGYRFFGQVRNFLDTCDRLSMEDFIQACNLLAQDPRFADFVVRSRAIVEQYMQRYAGTEESVKRDSPKCIETEMRRRKVNNTKLTLLLFNNS